MLQFGEQDTLRIAFLKGRPRVVRDHELCQLQLSQGRHLEKALPLWVVHAAGRVVVGTPRCTPTPHWCAAHIRT